MKISQMKTALDLSKRIKALQETSYSIGEKRRDTALPAIVISINCNTTNADIVEIENALALSIKDTVIASIGKKITALKAEIAALGVTEEDLEA